tara:strand:+ start:360 stop:488 length:129 start_codon:yes stop_codon:yes gene_type:complete
MRKIILFSILLLINLGSLVFYPYSKESTTTNAFKLVRERSVA